MLSVLSGGGHLNATHTKWAQQMNKLKVLNNCDRAAEEEAFPHDCYHKTQLLLTTGAV